MVNLSNNGFIVLNRGDTFDLPLFINNGNSINPIRTYIHEHPRATIYFGLMEPNQRFEQAILKKHYTAEDQINQHGDLVIHFKSTDTEYLLPGKYYYSVKCQVVPFDHNIEYQLPEKHLTIVYGWEDETQQVTINTLYARLPDLTYQKPVQAVGVKRGSAFIPVFIGYLNDQLYIYSEVDPEDNPTQLIDTVPLEDFYRATETVAKEAVVDTLISPTEFLIVG